MKTFIILCLLTVSVFAQDIIDISVKGISNKKNDGAQQDRLEAILDAKRQACEKAGLTIESKTTVENFEVVYDFVETQAATVLMPGFQLIEIGYVQDGTYQVVLTGKIKVMGDAEPISAKELRYAKSLKDQGKHSKCEEILKKYIDSEDKDVPESLKEDAFYYFIKWGYAWNVEDSYQKFAAYYPQSKYIATLQAFSGFSAEPLYEHNKTYQSSSSDWQEAELQHNDITFTKKIEVALDTIYFNNFRGKTQTILFNYDLYSTNEEEPQTAYKIIINYFNGNIKLDPDPDKIIEVENRYRSFQAGGSPTFQHSSTESWFKDFKMKNLMIKGQVPVGERPFEQNVQFDIYQTSF